MIKSLWGAYTAMSTRHLNAKASLYVSLLPSRPPPSLPSPSLHFSTRRKALHGPGSGVAQH